MSQLDAKNQTQTVGRKFSIEKSPKALVSIFFIKKNKTNKKN